MATDAEIQGIPISDLPRENNPAGVDIPGVKSGLTVKVSLDTKADKSVVDALQSGVIRQPAVDTYNDASGGKTSLLSQYPAPLTGWDVIVKTDETKEGRSNRYNWNGTIWVDMGDPSEEVVFHNASIDGTVFGSFESAAASIPKNRRRRGMVLTCKLSASSFTSYQFVLGNPDLDGLFLNKNNWVVYDGIFDHRTLIFEANKETTRLQIPYLSRRRGVIVSYYDTIEDRPVVEVYKSTGVQDAAFSDSANWKELFLGEVPDLVSNKLILFDKGSEYTPNTYINTSGTISDTVSNGVTSNFISIIPNLEVGCSALLRAYAEYDKDGKLIYYNGNTSGVSISGRVTDTNASYIRVTVLHDGAPTPISSYLEKTVVRFVRGYQNTGVGNALSTIDGKPLMVAYAEKAGSVDSIDTNEIEKELSQEIININRNEDINKHQSGYDNTVRSLLSLDNDGVLEKTIVIPANGSKDRVLRLGLHGGIQEGDVLFDEIFFDGKMRKDFNDIRFLDEDGNVLDHSILSCGNYDFIRDSNLKNVNFPLSDGRIVGSAYSPRTGVYISSDNGATWTLVSKTDKTIVGVSRDDALFMYAPYGLYRLERNQNGSYTVGAEVLVLDLSSTQSMVLASSFAEDSKGNLYCGKYQDAWDAELFKSIDNGKTWASLYRSDQNQHVHHIYIHQDVIYVGLDGSRGAWNVLKTPRCMRSFDYGVTWETLPIPFNNRDFGITLIDKDGYGYGNGEAAILGGPAVYKTKDFVNYYTVVPVGQGVRKVVEWDDLLIAGGNAGQSNKVAQLYVSETDGEPGNWKTAYAENFADTGSSGAGFRWFTKPFIPAGGVEENIITHGFLDGSITAEYKPVRIFKGGDRQYGLCYLKLGDSTKPRTIKVKYGYKIEYPKLNPFNELIPNGLIFRMKLDEGRGRFAQELISGDLFNISGEFEWSKQETAVFNPVLPYYRPIRSGGIRFKENSRIEINKPLFFPNGMTVSFWANLKDRNTDERRFIFGDPAGFHIYAYYYRFYFADGSGRVNYLNSPWVWKGVDMWQLHTLRVSDNALYGSVNTNSNYSVTTDSPFDIKMNRIFIGGSNNNDPLSDIDISDIRVYDRVLTDKEIASIYQGFEVILQTS